MSGGMPNKSIKPFQNDMPILAEIATIKSSTPEKDTTDEQDVKHPKEVENESFAEQSEQVKILSNGEFGVPLPPKEEDSDIFLPVPPVEEFKQTKRESVGNRRRYFL